MRNIALRGLDIVGVSLDCDPETATAEDKENKWVGIRAEVVAYVQEKKLPWPQFYDGKGLDSPFS